MLAAKLFKNPILVIGITLGVQLDKNDFTQKENANKRILNRSNMDNDEDEVDQDSLTPPQLLRSLTQFKKKNKVGVKHMDHEPQPRVRSNQVAPQPFETRRALPVINAEILEDPSVVQEGHRSRLVDNYVSKGNGNIHCSTDSWWLNRALPNIYRKSSSFE